MNAHTWFMALVLAALFGGLIGWSARVHTQGDRYVKALSERHEAEISYWLHKLDDQIQQNKGDISKEKTDAKR